MNCHYLHRIVLVSALIAGFQRNGLSQDDCNCQLNMSFERALGSCFGQDCGCQCTPDPEGNGESWLSCPFWGCGSTDIGPNPGGSLNMGNTQPTNGNSFLSMECSGGPGGAGEGISVTLCEGVALQAGQEYCFAIDLITRANFGNNAGTSGLVIYGSNSPCQDTQTLWTLPVATGDWQTYNFCFTPTGNWSVISFRVLNPGGGFSAIGVDNWVSTDGLFPPQPADCLDVETEGDVICSGGCGFVSAIAASGTPPYVYVWSDGLPLGPGPHQACPPVTTVYSVTVTDALGVSSIGSAVVMVLEDDCLSINTQGAQICPGSCGEISVAVLDGTPPYQFLWSDGLPNSPGPHEVCPQATTVYSVTVIDSEGISATANATVTVLPQAPANAGPDVAVCVGESSQLNGSGGVLYEWNPPLGLSNPQIANPIAAPASTTVYTLTVADPNGCIGSDQMTLVVNPLPVADAGEDQSLCAGESVTLMASGGVVYSWSPATGLGNSQSGQTSASPLTTTLYTVTVTQNNGCTDTDSVTLTVLPAPSVNAGPDLTICAGQAENLNATGASEYSWSPPQGLTNPSVSNPTASPASTTTYTVTGTNDEGCSASDSMVLIVLSDFPFVSLPQDVTACLGSPVLLVPEGFSNQTYVWNTGDIGEAISVESSGTYTVTAANQCGTATASVSLVFRDCECGVFIPNAFTPDGDDNNEVWHPVICPAITYEAAIFDRWGEKIFHTFDQNEPWIGNVRGGNHYAENGVYVYVVKVTITSGDSREFVGHVTLIR